jgi:hypothetical protein
MADDSIRTVSEALDVLRRRGVDAAVAYLWQRLDVGIVRRTHQSAPFVLIGACDLA